MFKFLIVFSLIFKFQFEIYAQCTGISKFPAQLLNVPAPGQTLTVSTGSVNSCSQTNQYFEINLTGSYQRFNSTIQSDYFYITDLSNNYLVGGPSNTNFSFQTGGAFRVHIFSNSSCGTDNFCRGISIYCSSLIRAPILSTDNVFEVTNNSAKITASITENGVGSINQRGICFDPTKNPTIENASLIVNQGTTSFTGALTDLYPGTTYHARPYAYNNDITGYGPDTSFKTLGNPYPGCFGIRKKPAATQDEPNTIGQTKVISTLGSDCNYSGDYFDIILLGGNYTLFSSNPTDFFSITSVKGQKMHQGSNPFTFTIPPYGGIYNTFRVNVHGSPHCNSDQVCRSVSIVKNNSMQVPVVKLTGYGNLFVTSVTIESSVMVGENVTERGVCYSTSFPPTIANSKIISGSGIGAYNSDIFGLLPFTTYHFRSYATNNNGTSYSDVKSFYTTGGCWTNNPSITNSVTGPTTIGQTVSVVACSYSGEFTRVILSPGNYTVKSSNTTDYFTVSTNANEVFNAGKHPLTFTITNQGTYRLHVFDNAICQQSNVCRAISLTRNALPILPTISTNPISQINPTNVVCGGNLTNAGSGTITERGICYGLYPNPSIFDVKRLNGTATGSFSVVLLGLAPNTQYYIRAFATTSAGTAYGNNISFTTSNFESGCLASTQFPTTTVIGPSNNNQTLEVTNLGTNTCNFSGEYFKINLTTGTFTAISTNSADYFTLTDNSNTIISKGSSPFTFSVSSSGTYRIHVYKNGLCNLENVCRGVSIRKNSQAVLATVSTSNVTSITGSSALCFGNISSAGSGIITSRGICFATTTNPTTANSVINSGAGLGSFSGQLTGLTPGVVYYFRAFAISSAGTAYGNELSFTTLITNNNELIFSNDELKAFPNPIKNELTIKGIKNNKNAHFVIVNSLGMIVMQGNLESETSIIKVNTLASGLYTIRVAGRTAIKIWKE